MPPPAAMAIAALMMWAFGAALPGFDFDFPARRWAAVFLFAAGVAIGVGAFLQFRRADTTVNPMKPESSSALVTGGFFALSRNPIYVADVLILLGAALLFASAPAFVPVVLFVLYVDRFQIRPEERALRARFGEAYDDYCRRVRRWL